MEEEEELNFEGWKEKNETSHLINNDIVYDLFGYDSEIILKEMDKYKLAAQPENLQGIDYYYYYI